MRRELEYEVFRYLVHVYTILNAIHEERRIVGVQVFVWANRGMSRFPMVLPTYRILPKNTIMRPPPRPHCCVVSDLIVEDSGSARLNVRFSHMYRPWAYGAHETLSYHE